MYAKAHFERRFIASPLCTYTKISRYKKFLFISRERLPNHASLICDYVSKVPYFLLDCSDWSATAADIPMACNMTSVAFVATHQRNTFTPTLRFSHLISYIQSLHPTILSC